MGYNVYPVLSLRRLLDFVREISPDAIINMAHGRLGDEVVKYLEERNILLFAPLTVNSLVKEWEQDPMGMPEDLCHRVSLLRKLTGPSGRRHSLPSTRIKRDCVILLQFLHG